MLILIFPHHITVTEIKTLRERILFFFFRIMEENISFRYEALSALVMLYKVECFRVAVTICLNIVIFFNFKKS